MARKVRWVYTSLMLLGSVGGLAFMGSDAAAQTRAPILTVRPREMATATETVRAGEQTLDGKPHPNIEEPNECDRGCSSWSIAGTPMVYVPKQCVGQKRCPLVVIANTPKEYYYHIADKYGIITALIPGSGDPSNAATFDQGLQTVLRSFAIDPDKIAIMGRCATGQATADYGAFNPNVFSRVVIGTEHFYDSLPMKAPTQKTEYFVAGGITEGAADFWGIRRMRDRGYLVTHSLQFRGHDHTPEEYDYMMGRWLQERWAIPDPAARPTPYTFGDPVPLTAEIVAQMTDFWTRFMKEPDSIMLIGRRSLLREVLVPVGKEYISTLMVDMPALAAKYPPVAAALSAAKLTPQQHDIYRAALASTRIYDNASRNYENSIGNEYNKDHYGSVSADSILGIAPGSVLVKNREFMTAHQDEFTALEATEMWSTP